MVPNPVSVKSVATDPVAPIKIGAATIGTKTNRNHDGNVLFNAFHLPNFNFNCVSLCLQSLDCL
jgi:hypothetical protein